MTVPITVIAADTATKQEHGEHRDLLRGVTHTALALANNYLGYVRTSPDALPRGEAGLRAWVIRAARRA